MPFGLFRKKNIPIIQQKPIEIPQKKATINKLKSDIVSPSECPYCHVVLEKRPERKTKCRSCGNYIIVKTDPDTHQRLLVTEGQAEEIEARWQIIHDRNEGIRLIKSVGGTEADYEKLKKQLTSKNGRPPLRNDIFWSFANQRLHELMKTSDFHGMKMVYFHQAHVLGEEGKDPFGLLQEAAKCELYELKKTSIVKRIRVSTAGKGNACPNCFQEEGKEYTIEEAFKLMPIPHKECTKHFYNNNYCFCRCMYLAIVE